MKFIHFDDMPPINLHHVSMVGLDFESTGTSTRYVLYFNMINGQRREWLFEKKESAEKVLRYLKDTYSFNISSRIDSGGYSDTV